MGLHFFDTLLRRWAASSVMFVKAEIVSETR